MDGEKLSLFKLNFRRSCFMTLTYLGRSSLSSIVFRRDESRTDFSKGGSLTAELNEAA
jgi:hypothetical protein